MRFFATLAVFLGLGVSSVLGSVSLDSREASEVEVFDIPIHSRDFSIITKRGGKCTITVRKRSDGSFYKRAKNIGMNRAGSTSKSIDMDVNGCSGVFVWADKLYAVHAASGNLSADVDKLKTKVGTKTSSITHVNVVSPDAEDVSELEGLLTWTNKTPKTATYPFKVGAEGEDEYWTLKGSFSKKGSVSVTHHT